MKKFKYTLKKILNPVLNILLNFSLMRGVRDIWVNVSIRKKVLYTVGAIVFYRFLASVPPPGIDIKAFVEVFADNPLTNIFAMATGGRLDNPSLVMIGLGAYINASIIIQLLQTVIPKLEQLSEEGNRGKQVLNQYTRFLAIPLSIMQAIVIYILLSRSSALIGSAITIDVVAFIATISAGSLLLMWLGELISENGVGNGTSVLITFSIISSLPTLFLSDMQNVIPLYNSLIGGQITFNEFIVAPDVIFFLSVIFGLMLAVVLIVQINEGVRKVVVQYARRVIGGKTNFLPIRLVQAGVMPIIFASALLTFPGIITNLLSSSVDPNSRLGSIVTGINNSFIGDYNSLGYNIAYFILIIGFTFFYTFVVIKPSQTADNLKKSGGFIPGIRPGLQTEEYIKNVMKRLTTVGALFLALIAILPVFARFMKGIDNNSLGILSGIGGTSILIVVSVILTTYRQIKSMKVTKSYEQYR